MAPAKRRPFHEMNHDHELLRTEIVYASRTELRDPAPWPLLALPDPSGGTLTTGHTQPNASSTPPPGAKTRRPVPTSVRTPAGTNAHRCGWPVHRAATSASRAQPAANPSNAVPLMTGSCAPPNGPTTSTTAASNPKNMEPTTIGPIPCRPARSC